MPRNDLDKAYVSTEVLADMPNAHRFPPNAPRLFEILTFPSVQLLDVTGPLQVFATANEVAAIARQTDCAAVRLRVRGNDAPQFPTLTVGRAAGLSRAIQLLRLTEVEGDYLALGLTAAYGAHHSLPSAAPKVA
jgi:hypothetical protein